MLIAITKGTHTEYPERCPMVHRNARRAYICGHPSLDLGRTSLFCNYVNCPDEFVPASSRCPMKREPIDGLSVTAKGAE